MIYFICYVLAFIPLLIMFMCLKVVGRKRLRKKGPYIIVSNHMSNWDPVVIMFHRTRKTKFLAKKELMSKPFSKWFLGKLGGIPVNREKPEMSSIRMVFDELKAGRSVVIFPAGTRTKQPEMDSTCVKEGVSLFAIRSQVPVLPIMFAKKNRPFKRNKLIVGEPISPKGYSLSKESMEEFGDLICSKMNELLENNNGEKK